MVLVEQMKKYNVLYFSSGYSSVHKQIIESIRSKDCTVVPCLYTLHYSNRMFLCPDDAITYNNPSIFRGMLFWKKRMDDIVDYYDKRIDWSDVSVLHAHLLYTDGYICSRLSERHGIPFLVTIRNTDLNTKYYSLPTIKREMVKTVCGASTIIYLGKEYKSEFQKRLNNNVLKSNSSKFVCIPNGVDSFWHVNANNKRKCINNKCFSIITVGRIEPNKNQESVCRAIECLTRKGYEITYTLVGDKCDSKVEKIITSYSWTKIVPFQEKEKLIEFYRDNDIYVMPSKTETFGLVYVEALTQGLPIIYSKGQGFDGQFEEGVVGYHVNPYDVKDIENAIIQIINNYDAISSRCVAKSRVFTWDHIGDLFRGAYQKSIDEYNNSL